MTWDNYFLNIWTSTGYDKMSISKVKLRPLQSNRSNFNKHEVSVIFPLCKEDDEDSEHFLVSRGFEPRSGYT